MLLVLSLLVAAGGCTAAPPVRSVGTGGAADASACRPAELRALFRGFQGSSGPLAGAVVVIDAGTRPCTLAGSPRSVTLLDGGGERVPVKNRVLDVPSNAGAVGLAPGVPLPPFGAAPVHGSAWFTLTWTNWCADAPDVRSLLIVLPAGGSVTAPLDEVAPTWALAGSPAPRCDDARADSTLSFGRFQAANG